MYVVAYSCVHVYACMLYVYNCTFMGTNIYTGHCTVGNTCSTLHMYHAALLCARNAIDTAVLEKISVYFDSMRVLYAFERL